MLFGEMKRIRQRLIFFGLILTSLSPALAHATEEYSFSIAVPVVEGTKKAQLKKMSFRTYYSRTETLVNAITWDPCKAEGGSPDCGAINPLRAANVQVNVYAYNTDGIDHLGACYVKIDLSKYKPLPGNLQAAIEGPDKQAALIQLAVEGLQKNTRGKGDYVDCEIRIKGLAKERSLAELRIPQYINPVIPKCQPHSPDGRAEARSLNNQGMTHYRAKELNKAAESFRLAAAKDCDYFIARTNLASVLSLQKRYEESRSVLWRALKLDVKRTLQKLKTDPDYKGLKRWGNFYSAASPIGEAYRAYCYGLVKPGEVSPKLPGFMKQAGLRMSGMPYTVATRYAFHADFNKNGIPDQVIPLVKQQLSTVLVVFDREIVNPDKCTSTPLGPYDLSRMTRADPCKVKIFAGKQGEKRGIRVEAENLIGVNRLVCR